MPLTDATSLDTLRKNSMGLVQKTSKPYFVCFFSLRLSECFVTFPAKFDHGNGMLFSANEGTADHDSDGRVSILSLQLQKTYK